MVADRSSDATSSSCGKHFLFSIFLALHCLAYTFEKTYFDVQISSSQALPQPERVPSGQALDRKTSGAPQQGSPQAAPLQSSASGSPLQGDSPPLRTSSSIKNVWGMAFGRKVHRVCQNSPLTKPPVHS